ncbi:alpha/beta hydrolase [Flavimaricola marinus]|uniref:Thermostable monoacylglycerol lipase n=1 Tax=Flavimaricola marinus TaxID=1819565 RepID=A0A238LIV7_9RHOB|nr:alpha/beta hydrolase [Flavimaricola marinus]SMY09483.1 Thermostable monoacylglycerol lipase [Flavimaricola marinus]
MRHLPDLEMLDDWIATTEAAVPGLRPQCAKHIVWPTDARVQADVAVVYVHGFSASPKEIAPVPERLAAALGAPLFAARLTGHGIDGEAMARATCADWEADVSEALAIGAKLGKRIIVIGCSTGCTLLTIAMGQGADVAGAVFVSPNFKMSSKVVQAMLMAPGVRAWGSYLVGQTRSFPPISDAHAAHWTNSYPTAALWPMADAMRKVYALDLGRIKVPAFFATCRTDRVVSPTATQKVAAVWGGPVTHLDVVMGRGDDSNGHVIAGDIMCPGQTDRVANAAIDWARSIL